MKRILFQLLFLTSMLLCSCDTLVTYRYLVRNDYAAPIQVHYSVSQIDSTFTLPSDQEFLIFEEKRVNHGITDFMGEDMFMFSILDIQTTDSVKIKTDIHKRNAWEFSNTNSAGIYRLIVNDKDF